MRVDGGRAKKLVKCHKKLPRDSKLFIVIFNTAFYIEYVKMRKWIDSSIKIEGRRKEKDIKVVKLLTVHNKKFLLRNDQSGRFSSSLHFLTAFAMWGHFFRIVY